MLGPVLSARNCRDDPWPRKLPLGLSGAKESIAAQSTFTKAESHSFPSPAGEEGEGDEQLRKACRKEGASRPVSKVPKVAGRTAQPQDKEIEQLEVRGWMCAGQAPCEGRRGRRRKHVTENDSVVKRTQP